MLGNTQQNQTVKCVLLWLLLLLPILVPPIIVLVALSNL
jgi:hypothetical protein